MAKNDLAELAGISSASTAAFVEAARQSLRLVNGLGAHSALKAQMQLSSSIAFSPALRETFENHTAMVQRMKPTFAPPQMPVIPSLALMAGLQAGAARAMKTHSMLMSSGLTQAAAARAAAQVLASHRSSYESALDALRNNQQLFSHSSELLRAIREGAAGVRAMESAHASSLTAVLRGIRQDQPRFKSIVESLATATIADLAPGEAREVATAFEEAVVAQAGAVGTEADAGRAGAQLVLDEFNERLLEAFIARLPPERAGGSFIAHLGIFIAVIQLLLGLATYKSDIENAKSDVRNTQEITSRQDESNVLLRSLLEESRKRSGVTVQQQLRVVDRKAYILGRPAKGAAVIAVLPKGVPVAVIGVRGKWAEITYIDAPEVTRTGWVLKKYLE